MFSSMKKDDNKKNESEVCETVTEGLKKLYKQDLRPLEEASKFHKFHSPALEDADFDAKPMVLLIGQYSTGKTSFIKYLLESDFPGIRIGPEPTTDGFIAVMHGEKDGVIPGNACVVDKSKQFRQLSKFGNAFLNRFQCSQMNNPVLKSISIVDTPGILSGEKQRVARGYDFCAVIEWLAERVDRIILLFDAHKLDISDEFKNVIERLRGYDDKIRIVLNKADQVNHQQLMRVYGALMWSLGKVLRTPEVSRVYLGSFWDQPLHYDMNRRLFELEEQDLFNDIQSLPRNATVRKLNDLIKRARLVKVHAYIMAHLKEKMPAVFGKDSKKEKLIKNLGNIFQTIQKEHQISAGDFPNLERMQEFLKDQDFSKLKTIKSNLIANVDKMLANDVARLMSQIPNEEAQISDTVIVYDEGGHWRGLGTAWHLAEQGKQVTLITSDPYVGKEITRTSADIPLRARLAKLGVRVMTESVIAEWHGDRASVRTFLDGSMEDVPATALVMSTTNRAFEPLSAELQDLDVRIIGDAAAPRQAPYAFHEGRKTGIAI